MTVNGLLQIAIFFFLILLTCETAGPVYGSGVFEGAQDTAGSTSFAG